MASSRAVVGSRGDMEREEMAQEGQEEEGRSPEMTLDPGTDRQEAILCDICSEHEAVKTCLTCTMSYCETHIRTHYTKPALQKHTLVEVCDGADEHGKIKDVPVPDKLHVDSVAITSASLSWSQPDGMDQNQHQYQVSYQCYGAELIRTISSPNISLSGLQPATDYRVSVSTVLNNGSKSQPVSISFKTRIPAPCDLKSDQVHSTSLTLHWTILQGMENIFQHFLISYRSPGSVVLTVESTDCSTTLSDLQPGNDYIIHVSTVTKAGTLSRTARLTTRTRLSLKQMLSQMGLENSYEDKLKLSAVLEINPDTLADELINTKQSLPRAFLKKLMMSNVNARGVKCVTPGVNSINPLDLITAVFLCSDGFLQQEMALKMSMCQFAVPLLLPNCETEEITMMLWALRDIVKKFRPPSKTATKAFVEERIVSSKIPMVSFVRIGNSEVSKSNMLNKLLSNPQQHHETFVHYNMDCGDVPRSISNGLVEICWYLPCGNRNTDIFPQPLAVANLRGDIKSFEKQFSFLCQTSDAVYIFSDDLNDDVFKVFKTTEPNKELFLVDTSQKKIFKIDTHTQDFVECSNHRPIIGKQNDAEFVKVIQSSVSKVLTNTQQFQTMECKATIAHRCMITVDEDIELCKTAREQANFTMMNLQYDASNTADTARFKKEELPFQGQVWKTLSQLGKERCRLRNAHGQVNADYLTSLTSKERELRKEQQSYEITPAMVHFITGVSKEGLGQLYFLKWLRISLDNLSRETLAGLREQYKDLCQNSPGEKDKIVELDRKISDCSLGFEHFLRELGQLYESASSLPPDSLPRKIVEHLPGLCARMLLDGLPIELMDGDASNIPMTWISEVLRQLHNLVDSKSRIRVVTVLGVQSTGKSTLLNTMFGVQFAVSSGRCTRGAFMVLIRVSNDLKDELKCDFMMVIDTEGLKSPELAQLDYSYEHDNELATLVVGLSDVTIINVAMENSTEMKDILQIVVHAFIRMREVGKRPVCHFVHQNVPDMSAYDSNMRDRKKLMEQLNEMTLVAAEMERKENITKFTDVMQFDPDTNCCYIPGLWHGTPPMAPVNAGYSDAVQEFKKTLMEDFKKCQRKDDLTHFTMWTDSLWEAVKYEKFIFSFRNSIVAHAYTSLCSEYNRWEWTFQKNMYDWATCEVNKMSNLKMADLKSEKVFRDFIAEANELLSRAEGTILHNLEEYFTRKDSNVELVEKYKQDFVNSARNLTRETNHAVKSKWYAAFEMKESMYDLNNTMSMLKSKIKTMVQTLVKECKQTEAKLSDEDLRVKFEEMWKKTLSEIRFPEIPLPNPMSDAEKLLKQDPSTQGSSGNSVFLNTKLSSCGQQKFTVQYGFFEQGKGVVRHGNPDHYRKKVQCICDDIIAECNAYIEQTVRNKNPYQVFYLQEIFKIIAEKLQLKKGKVSEDNEVSLKMHICAIAARQFEKMHEDFIALNDPQEYLSASKTKYCTDFIDSFFERDQCQKNADEFTKNCLELAVLDYATKKIGPEIVDEITMRDRSECFRNPQTFHLSILQQLLIDLEFDKTNYNKYQQYIKHYEKFMKEWLLEQIVQILLKDNKLETLEKKHLSEIITEINTTIANTVCKSELDNNVEEFIQTLCDLLGNKLVFSSSALESIMILNDTDLKQFADCLTESVNSLETSLNPKYETGNDIKERLKYLPFKPQDKMFKDLLGCGEECPFCGAACEKGSKKHRTHSTSIHRPQGIIGWRDNSTNILDTNVCSVSVVSDRKFSIPLEAYKKTVWSKLPKFLGQKGRFRPCKNYQKYYPDWEIQGDTRAKVGDYWKYVLVTFNERIAEDCGALPADIPEDWKRITYEDAKQSLKRDFNME